MKGSSSESKPCQSRSKVKIPGQAWRKEGRSRSKLKQADTFHVFNVLGSAHETFGV